MTMQEDEKSGAIIIPFAKLPAALYIAGPCGRDDKGDLIIIPEKPHPALIGICPKCQGTDVDHVCKTSQYQIFCNDCKEITSPWLRTPGGMFTEPGKENTPVDQTA
jgi:hypothetical protein